MKEENIQKNKIVEKITNKIKSNFSKKESSLIIKFIKSFYASVSIEDLESHDISDLYGAIISFWDLIKQRKKDELKIRIFNPDLKQNKWQSANTVIEIVQKDMPFLVDSIMNAINRLNLTSHLVIHSGDVRFKRNNKDQIVEILNGKEKSTANITSEALLYIEIDKQKDPHIIKLLEKNIRKVCHDISLVVADWNEMRVKIKEVISQWEKLKTKVPDIQESIEFLKWIEMGNFTFLGVVDYKLDNVKNKKILRLSRGKKLGLFKTQTKSYDHKTLTEITTDAKRSIISGDPLLISKISNLSTIHRPTYPDYIGIKLYDSNGKIIGERTLIGLFTSIAYNTNPQHIPLLRQKVIKVIEKSGLHPNSHGGKTLQNILDTFPRDDLFQASVEDLLQCAKGIYAIQERRGFRLFIRYDEFGKFWSCLMYVPRERFNTDLREEMQAILMEELGGKEISFATHFSESVLARIHYVIRVDPKAKKPKINVKEIEQTIINKTKNWEEKLAFELTKHFGKAQGENFFTSYKKAFSLAYKEDFAPKDAVYDIEHINKLCEKVPISLNLYKLKKDPSTILRFKIFQIRHTIPLSDVVPILENMGIKVISEEPYQIKSKENEHIWISEFRVEPILQPLPDNLDEMKKLVQECFLAIWEGRAESDQLNRLVISAGLNWQEVSILRAYAKYLKQIRFQFSKVYIEEILNSYHEMVGDFIKLFHCKFSPNHNDAFKKQCDLLNIKLTKTLNAIANINEDTILRRYHELILATTRTNFYQKDHGENQPYFSFKLKSQKITDMPLPVPLYEIFVYSPNFEGIHLRNSKVARGGIRWSDRKEDFRTEVLGLMKAQVVKNAVIVPSGAKGGFFVKSIKKEDSRETINEKGLESYKQFVSGLLDLTDNLVGSKIVPPKNVMRYDDDDPYLVVAADKGTATFSDVANQIAKEYNFWLDDAFASGGKTGYDHKKLGITACGAWESVKRNFREIDKNIQKNAITIIGIGDMSGDVFGNGMLLSKKIKLVAAFNHSHIFIDPDPDPKLSYKERKRLFSLKRSSWTDYNKKILSKGAGIYNRWDKSISLSKEAQALLDTKKSKIDPDSLIKLILKLSVDLLWNGGIGTYVKGKDEEDYQIGDKSNDNIRIVAQELQCKVIGEGGNLGLTQLARVEYSLKGGLVYTDFIDNSAGVDCSDHEVNIKILLNDVVQCGDMAIANRNKLLVDMTEDVVKLVLNNNYRQTQIISLEAERAYQNIELHARYINHLEEQYSLNRSLEYLPKEDALLERKQRLDKGLTKPEIANLLSHTKTNLKEEILQTGLAELALCSNYTEKMFPEKIRKKYKAHLQHHNLKKEIIATQLSNEVINDMGFSFVFRLHDETGATTSEIVKAYAIAKQIFNLDELWREVSDLDNLLTPLQQNMLFVYIIRFMRSATRWFIKNYGNAESIGKTVEKITLLVVKITNLIPSSLIASDLEYYINKCEKYRELSMPDKLASQFAISRAKYSVLDIVQTKLENPTFNLNKFMKIYFAIGDYLQLNWLRTQVIKLHITNHWEAFSKEALRDDLNLLQKQLSISVYKYYLKHHHMDQIIQKWSEDYSICLMRWKNNLTALKSQSKINLTIIFAVIRELHDFNKVCKQYAHDEI